MVGVILGMIFGAGGLWMLASNDIIQLNALSPEEPCEEIINIIEDCSTCPDCPDCPECPECPEEPVPEPPMIADFWTIPKVESSAYTYNTIAPIIEQTKNLAFNLTVNGTCYLQNLTIRLYTQTTTQKVFVYLKPACLLSNNQVIPPPLSYPSVNDVNKATIVGDYTYTFSNLNFLLNCSETFQNTFYLQFSTNKGTIYPYFLPDTPTQNIHELIHWDANLQYTDWAYDLALDIGFSKQSQTT